MYLSYSIVNVKKKHWYTGQIVCVYIFQHIILQNIHVHSSLFRS